MNDDPMAEIRRRVAELSPEQLQAALDAILGGEPAGLAPEEGPRVPELPTLHEPPAEPALLTVRVDVDETAPPVWRRLVLRGDLTLDEVHALLQAAFGWQDYHLHRFWPGPAKRLWQGPFFVTEHDLEEGEDGVLESGVRLDQLLRGAGDRLFYTYDFGDDWTHTIRLESVAPMEGDAPRAVCTGGRMAGPLEDSGGSGGHNELVQAFLDDPDSLAGLDEHERAWLPEGWDPTRVDVDEVNQALSLVGLTAEAVLRAISEEGPGGGAVELPAALEPLMELAPPPVAAELARMCLGARYDIDAELSAEDLAVISRPYRYLVDLAGADGIPLTAAGWMRPAYVERVYRDLGLDADWIGKGNREDQTLPVLQLREMCQRLGLLRRYKGRLVRTRLARSLGTDEEYVDLLASRLLRDRDPFVQAGMALFAVLTAHTGRALHEHMGTIAGLMTGSGLRTGPAGVEERDVLGWVRPVWVTLQDVTGRTFRDHDVRDHPGDHRAVALARRALWPKEGT